MIELCITSETSELDSVVVGIADDFGGRPKITECYDPKSKEHVIAGTFPKQNDILFEINNLVEVFEKYSVNVFRPLNIKGLNQIFSRDIAFVIEDKIVIPNIIKNRKQEIFALNDVLSKIKKKNIIEMPYGTRVEGGDVIVHNDFVFVGYSEQEDFEKYIVARTNRKGLDFLAHSFPNKKIQGFELNKSDNNPKKNSLHLDCCFQPIGSNMAILYKGGFKNKKDVAFLINYFGSDNIIEIYEDEMYNMTSNIFSISEDIIISEQGFTRLNNELTKRGFLVEEVIYSEIAKMEGLLRCSTMPLKRKGCCK